MKVIQTDNYNRDTVAEKLIAENLPKDEAEAMAKSLNTAEGQHSDRYFIVVDEEYTLWRGMEELI